MASQAFCPFLEATLPWRPCMPMALYPTQVIWESAPELRTVSGVSLVTEEHA